MRQQAIRVTYPRKIDSKGDQMLMYDTEVAVGDKNHSALSGYILHQFILCNKTCTKTSEEKNRRKIGNFRHENDISIRI